MKKLRQTELKGSGAKYGKGKKNLPGIKSQEGIKDEREAKEPGSCQASWEEGSRKSEGGDRRRCQCCN